MAVKNYFGLQASYNQLSNIDNQGIYYITDTGRIYRGNTLISNYSVEQVTILPATNVAVLGRIYLVEKDGNINAYVLKQDKSKFILLNQITSIDADNTPITNLTLSSFKSNVIATTISNSPVDTKLTTEKAVRDALDAIKNPIDSVSNTNTINMTINQSNGNILSSTVNVSAKAKNFIEVNTSPNETGLYVGEDASKINKVDSAVSGNIAEFNDTGAIQDSNIAANSILVDSDIQTVLKDTGETDLTIPSSKSVVDYILLKFANIAGGLIYKGALDATNPEGNSNWLNAKIGYFFKISVAGTIDTVSFQVGDALYINNDAVGQPTKSDFDRLSNVEITIIDNLLSTDSTAALSANQGKILNDSLSTKLSTTSTIDGGTF